MVPDPLSPDGSGEGHVSRYPSWKDDQPALAIVEAVARVKDTAVGELEPLHRTIPTDELNELFDSRTGRTEFYRSSGESSTAGPNVTFRYESCIVTVTSEEIRIERG